MEQVHGAHELNVCSRKKEKKEKKLRKQHCWQKSSTHQLRKTGHLGRKAPSPENKKAVSVDQEGCRETSQQTSSDY